MDDIPLSWARDLLTFSLRATATTENPYISAKEPELSDPLDPGKDPRFRKLVDAVLFSRRLLLTYNVVLLALLLIFTVWHWGEKLMLARRRRQRLRDKRSVLISEEEEHAWSSSSSTLEGAGTPPNETKIQDADETSPLLASSIPRKRKVSRVRSAYNHLNAFLHHQPAPLPLVNRTLPPNSLSLFVLAFFVLNAFYNLYRNPLDPKYLFVFADRCGILFVANLPLLYLLSAKNQPLKFLTGQSYEALNIFHRRVGELLCFEALLHLVGMLGVWYGLLRRLGFSLTDFLLSRVVLLGLGAFLAYEILYFTSLASFRQKWYEIFLATHIFLQTAGLVLLFFHHSTSRPYVAISLAIFLIDRLVFRLWLRSSSYPATLEVLPDGETILLSANWDIKERSNALIPRSMRHGWTPNDHIFLSIPSLSTKDTLQSHPFTIFSAAPYPSHTSGQEQDSEPQHAWFSLLIRTQGSSGFTHRLLLHAQHHHSVRIRLDGPYGSSHALDILEASDNAIIVAGGSGIAVAYPLLWALLRPASKMTTSDVEDARWTRMRRKVRLLWITHYADHRSWVPRGKMEELQEWGLEVFIPAPTALAGRPNVGKVLRGWIDQSRTGVVVSGPDGLVRDVRNTCAGLLAEGRRVSVQVEKFGW